jgi:hypothetical protein
LLLLSVLLLLSPVLAQELSEAQKAEVYSSVMDCVNDVNNCDCAGFDEEGQAYCNNTVTGVMACLVNLSSSECQSIDPTKVIVNGVSIAQAVRDKVLTYDESITSCVTSAAGCDCNSFPVSVRDFCEDKKAKETACLDNYDLDACMTLDNPDLKIFPDWTPSWIIAILDPIIRPLVEWRQQSERDMAVGSAMNSIGTCFADPYNCDCSSIKFPSIKADCMQRARLMRTCLEYRDCLLTAGNNTGICTGIEACTSLVEMPLVPEVTPWFIKPFIEPVVLQNVCPMMTDWPYDKGNYASCN